MNKRTKLVFAGFIELTTSERNELIDEMNKFVKMEYKERSALAEEYKSLKVSLGPISTETCPCCGR